jgi:hypothetical protein
MKYHCAPFSSIDIEIVTSQSKTNKELKIGDRVQLNSGGPCLTVVDADPTSLVVAWEDCGEVCESRASRACYRALS